MPTEVRALLPIRTYAGPSPVRADQIGNPFLPTEWEDVRHLMADGGDGEFFLLDLTACPLDAAEIVATSDRWRLPRASERPDQPIALMPLGPARAAGLVVLAHVTAVLEQKPKSPRK